MARALLAFASSDEIGEGAKLSKWVSVPNTTEGDDVWQKTVSDALDVCSVLSKFARVSLGQLALDLRLECRGFSRFHDGCLGVAVDDIYVIKRSSDSRAWESDHYIPRFSCASCVSLECHHHSLFRHWQRLCTIDLGVVIENGAVFVDHIANYIVSPVQCSLPVLTWKSITSLRVDLALVSGAMVARMQLLGSESDSECHLEFFVVEFSGPAGLRSQKCATVRITQGRVKRPRDRVMWRETCRITGGSFN